MSWRNSPPTRSPILRRSRAGPEPTGPRLPPRREPGGAKRCPPRKLTRKAFLSTARRMPSCVTERLRMAKQVPVIEATRAAEGTKCRNKAVNLLKTWGRQVAGVWPLLALRRGLRLVGRGRARHRNQEMQEQAVSSLRTKERQVNKVSPPDGPWPGSRLVGTDRISDKVQKREMLQQSRQPVENMG